MICKICNLETLERSHFWKEHKIKEYDYYSRLEPKFDLFTKEVIEFIGWKNKSNNSHVYGLTELGKSLAKMNSMGTSLSSISSKCSAK